MYCVIQEIKVKKDNKYSKHKELKVHETLCTFNGKTTVSYWYSFGDEKFERLIKKAYKISIHKSYREGGVVKKKQWIICTMNYYDIAEGSTWIQDYMRLSKWDKLLGDMKLSEEKLYELINKKLDPLILKVKSEYQITEEFITDEKNKIVITKYVINKKEFKKKYNSDDYDECFDVFGALRNEEHLNKIKSDYETQQNYQRGYQENKQSNYNYESYSGYQEIKQSNHNDKDKDYLRKFYKVLAMKFHPDICNDDGEAMKLINQLKSEWGL